MAPPCPLRAKRLPFGLSRRMMRPQSTSAARCRRSVAGAMPCARSASCWLDGKHDQSLAAQRRLRMEAEQSVENSERALGSADAGLGRADRAKHLPLVHGLFRRPRLRHSPGSPHGQASAIAAQRASLNYGVAFLTALNWAKEIRSPKRRSVSHETLDSDSRKWDSRGCYTDEKGFRNSVSGAFFFCWVTPGWWRVGTRQTAPVDAARETGQTPRQPVCTTSIGRRASRLEARRWRFPFHR